MKQVSRNARYSSWETYSPAQEGVKVFRTESAKAYSQVNSKYSVPGYRVVPELGNCPVIGVHRKGTKSVTVVVSMYRFGKHKLNVPMSSFLLKLYKPVDLSSWFQGLAESPLDDWSDSSQIDDFYKLNTWFTWALDFADTRGSSKEALVDRAWELLQSTLSSWSVSLDEWDRYVAFSQQDFGLF